MNKELIDYYSRDISVFAEQILGVKLRWYQKLIIKLFARYKEVKFMAKKITKDVELFSEGRVDNTIFFIDTETGGLDPDKHSLLSIGIVIWRDGRVMYKTEFYVKNEVYNVTASALNINKLNIRDLYEQSNDKKEIINFFKEMKRVFLHDNRITLGGHNTAFDKVFLKKMYEDCGMDFNEDFGHRMVDTASILKFMYAANKLDEDLSASNQAFEYFNLMSEDDKRRHTALGDCEATVRLFEALTEMVR